MTVATKQTIEIGRGQAGFDELDFIARSVSDDETRYFMNYIHVENPDDAPPVAVATDGRRLHYWQSDGVTLEPGAYRVEKHQKTKLVLSKLTNENEIGQFPNWRRVIPEPEDLGQDVVTFALKGSSTKNALLANVGPQYTKLVEQWGAAFNVRYLLDLEGFSFEVRALSVPEEQRSENHPRNNAHVFDSETSEVHALVMPMERD